METTLQGKSKVARPVQILSFSISTPKKWTLPASLSFILSLPLSFSLSLFHSLSFSLFLSKLTLAGLACLGLARLLFGQTLCRFIFCGLRPSVSLSASVCLSKGSGLCLRTAALIAHSGKRLKPPQIRPKRNVKSDGHRVVLFFFLPRQQTKLRHEHGDLYAVCTVEMEDGERWEAGGGLQHVVCSSLVFHVVKLIIN